MNALLTQVLCMNAQNAHRVDLSHSPDICTLLLAGSQHILANSMEVYDNRVEVSHKAAGVCSSSIITDRYVASFPGLFPTSYHFQDTLKALLRPTALLQGIYRSTGCTVIDYNLQLKHAPAARKSDKQD